MPRFAANLTMLYTEVDFLARFAAAAADGFDGVEFAFAYAWPKATVAARLADSGLPAVLINAPPGDWDRGERGTACLPGREAEFKASIALALDYAEALAAPRIHVMAGIVPAGADPARLRETYLRNLDWAATQAATAGRDLMIEPINPRDMPGYFLSRQADAHAIVAELGSPRVQVQLDLYHGQIVDGDAEALVRRYLPTGKVGHMQMASVPERHEPDDGLVDYARVFAVIDEVSAACGWSGWVGAEYWPRLRGQPGGTSEGLDWLRRWKAADVRPT